MNYVPSSISYVIMVSSIEKGLIMALDNKQIYKKTIGFSYRRFLWDFLAFLVVVGTTIAGFFIAENGINNGLIGLIIGAVIGIIAVFIILRYFAYSYKAGQIAMMTKGITEGKLPSDVIGEGKKIVKQRFTTVAAYFAVTSTIKGVFRQISNGLTAAGRAIGGDSGGAVGGAIGSAVETVVAYLCDCCLGWVFYRKDEKTTKASLEGAAIFFKHGKTLLKNLGRIFGFSILSFLVIGGVFTGIAYLILMNFHDAFVTLSQELTEAVSNSGDAASNFLSDPFALTITCALIIGIVFWSILHSVFVRPFILVGVLRNFIESGKGDIPGEKEFAELDKKSKKFAKLHSEA